MVPSARCAAHSSAFSKRIEIDRLTNKNELRRVKVLRTEMADKGSVHSLPGYSVGDVLRAGRCGC